MCVAGEHSAAGAHADCCEQIYSESYGAGIREDRCQAITLARDIRGRVLDLPRPLTLAKQYYLYL